MIALIVLGALLVIIVVALELNHRRIADRSALVRLRR